MTEKQEISPGDFVQVNYNFEYWRNGLYGGFVMEVREAGKGEVESVYKHRIVYSSGQVHELSEESFTKQVRKVTFAS